MKDISKYFIDLQSDFYHYMVDFGNIAPKTASDYITRLKFLSENYRIDYNLTIEDIDHIITQENNLRQSRDKYSTPKAMSDFRSGLNKFYAFIQFDLKKQYEAEIKTEINKINKSPNLLKTEKTTIIQSRIGQGNFRKDLINYWKGCSFSKCEMREMLIASHIKPWRVSDNNERLDYFNGFLLLPNYDKLFDLGYITIDIKGKFIYSKFLPEENYIFFNLKKLSNVLIEDRHKPYLKYHNNHCFMG